MAPLKTIAFTVAATLLFVASPCAASAQQGNLRLVEQDIKAGLLYNFLRYTQWPASMPTMVVCTYGGDAFDGRLAPMAGRTVNQRAIQLRDVRTGSDIDACSLLFINAASRADWPRLRERLAGRSVLTVSDYEGFARSGGMLEFSRINNRIGVRVNVAAADAANLSVEDRLLRLASVVRTEPQ